VSKAQNPTSLPSSTRATSKAIRQPVIGAWVAPLSGVAPLLSRQAATPFGFHPISHFSSVPCGVSRKSQPRCSLSSCPFSPSRTTTDHHGLRRAPPQWNLNHAIVGPYGPCRGVVPASFCAMEAAASFELHACSWNQTLQLVRERLRAMQGIYSAISQQTVAVGKMQPVFRAPRLSSARQSIRGDREIAIRALWCRHMRGFFVLRPAHASRCEASEQAMVRWIVAPHRRLHTLRISPVTMESESSSDHSGLEATQRETPGPSRSKGGDRDCRFGHRKAQGPCIG
jgi:hypothetical protein